MDDELDIALARPALSSGANIESSAEYWLSRYKMRCALVQEDEVARDYLTIFSALTFRGPAALASLPAYKRVSERVATRARRN